MHRYLKQHVQRMNKQCGGSPCETTSLKQALLDSIRISKVCMTSQTITPITGEDKLPLILLRDTTKTLNEFVRTVMPQFAQLWDTYLNDTVSMQIVEKFKQILLKLSLGKDADDEYFKYDTVELDENTKSFVNGLCKHLNYKNLMTLLQNRFDFYNSGNAHSKERVLLVTDEVFNDMFNTVSPNRSQTILS